MTLRHLEVFVAVYDEGGVSAAGRTLNVAQPAISQAIKELEREHGVLLFERLSRRLHPTAAADRLVLHARRLLGQYAELEKILADSRDRPLLRVGASATVGTYVLPGIVAGFSARRPDARVIATIDNTAVIEGMLLRDELDVGIVEGALSAGELSSASIADDGLVIIAGQADPLAGAGKLTPENLSGRGFAVRERGSGTRELFETAMAREGIAWEAVWTSTDPESIINAVAAGIGLAAVPRRAAERRSADVATLTAPFLRLERTFRIVSHKDKFESGVLADFRNFCAG